MAQRFNPATGQWEEDTTTSTGGDPPGAMPLPDSAGKDPNVTAAPFAPAPAPANVPAPGNDANQIQGWASKFLGRNFTENDIQGLNGQPLDLVMHNIANSPEAMAYAQKSAGPAASSAQTGTAAAAPPSGPAVAPANPFNDQVRQLLMAQLAKAGQPVDPNSPEIAATMSSASDAGVRASDAERTALAERLYAQGGGLNTDALTRQIQQSGEKQAGTLSTLKGQLLMQQYTQKAQQLQQDLQLAIQSGDAESARQVQMAIANLSAAVQREGLGVNLSEFGAALDQNAAFAGLRG